MSKTTARLLVAAVLLLNLGNWVYARKTKAAAQITYGQPACKSFVPPSWGEYRGSSEHYGVVFEDKSGTIRFITNVPCETTPQVALEIRRGNPPN
jgi:hypothetical protein